MQNSLSLASAAALAALLALGASAAAADPYLGLSLATPGEASVAINARTTVGNENHPTALKFYGGWQLSPAWAIELGYGAFGSWRFSDPTPGSRDKASIAASAVTVAARYSLDLGPSFALFGKLGLAANRFKATDSAGQTAQAHLRRPMWGLGLEWRLTPQLSVPLEFEYLGQGRTELGKFQQQKLELGLRYRF